MGPSRAETGWVVVIGASTGGAAALCELVAQLPQDFAAPVLVVQHIGSHRSGLVEKLAACGPLPVSEAYEGAPLTPGMIFVAPPDAHLLVERHTMRLSRGPKVNHTRPAVDPLLRTCAIAHGPRAIGIVLSGRLDDGTAGLLDIKRCGGLAIVQDPGTAEAADMPMSALDHVQVDYCVPPDAIGPVLVRIVAGLPRGNSPSEELLMRLGREQQASEGAAALSFVPFDAEPTLQTCPDCGGTLWQVKGSRPPRFACHTGHALSLRALTDAQHAQSEHALRSAVRLLRERASLMRQIQAHEHSRGKLDSAEQAGRDADAAQRQADGLMQLVEQGPV